MTENRRFPRATWITPAQVYCRDENVHWNVRLSDISEGGCFVDTLVPLAGGAPVLLRVMDGAGPLEIPGNILYGQQTIGSAIRFDALDAAIEQRVRSIVDRFFSASLR